jgi:FkbM family methyltransferase
MRERIKTLVGDTLSATLGRKNFARLARYLWLHSRLDVLNDMSHNGELLVQRAIARETKAAAAVRIFDVGANVGSWTDHMIRQLIGVRGSLDGCELHLFEPAPAALELLRQRLSGHTTHVRIVPKAVAAQAGRSPFSLFDPVAGNNTLQPLSSDPSAETMAVDCVALDDYCSEAGIDRIDFLKIDTEGNDHNVLLGAAGLLRAGHIACVQLEYNHRWVAFRRYLKDVFDLVLPLGYSIGKITPHGIEHYAQWHPELESFREGNYLLWRHALPDRLPRLRWWLD